MSGESSAGTQLARITIREKYQPNGKYQMACLFSERRNESCAHWPKLIGPWAEAVKPMKSGKNLEEGGVSRDTSFSPSYGGHSSSIGFIPAAESGVFLWSLQQ